MSLIHHTTVTPTKLELLTPWLPARPWFRGDGEPELAKTGGFRLDDPAGEVGIEFLVASAGSVAYHVPMTYRGAPLTGADDGLIGTLEHGVLGRRWVYDAAHDPVFVDALLALWRGEAQPQHQSVTDTADETVLSSCGEFERLAAAPVVTSDGPAGTDVQVCPGLVLRVRRVLEEGVAADGVGNVSARWQGADGAERRGVFAELVAR